MALTQLEIVRRAPYAEGRSFAGVGPYERIDARAHYAVDPTHAANRCIVDLDLAERADDAKVHFWGDLTVLRPLEPARGNRSLLVEVPNRGHRIALRQLNMAPVDLEATARLEPGDGHLFARGWTVAWVGWQWDVPRSEGRIGLEPPYVADEAALGQSRMQLRIQPDRPRATLPLTDQHVGEIGRHRTIAPAEWERDPSTSRAELWVRETIYSPATLIAREAWRFCELDDEPDGQGFALDGGFEPGKIYDIVFRPARAPVTGAGLVAVRDAGAFLTRASDSPLAGDVDHAFAEGISQCGRFLRTFVYFGLNADEQGAQVYDGMLIHVAGGRRGEFNHRFAQPSVQPTPSYGHRFPFADAPHVDPHSGNTAGLLDAARASATVPRIFYTDTSSEYWRGDAGLTHSDPATGEDLALPAEVRRYLFSSTQHGPGELPLRQESPFRSRGANWFNIIDYRPLYRAALANLRAWVVDDVPPPPSCYPRYGEGTAARRAEVVEKLRRIEALALPDVERMPRMVPLDLGPQVEDGHGDFPARVVGPAYPDVVSAVDEDGNETGGIPMPDITCPVATYTGFNPRHADSGGPGQTIEYIGSTLPFAATSGKSDASDPRPSLQARYASREGYLATARTAAQALVEQRFLDPDDVPLCVEMAAERYDAVLALNRP